MGKRKVTRLPAPEHAEAMHLVEMGGMFFSSSIEGREPSTGVVADDDKAQYSQAFSNLAAMLASAGRVTTEIGLITLGVPKADETDGLVEPFTQMFPDPAVRPTLRINQYPMPPGIAVQMQVTGVIDAAPRPVVTDVHSTALAPVAVRIGDLIFTSGVEGRDASGALGGTKEAQVRQGFDNLRAILEAEGATWDDALHVYAYFRDRKEDQKLMHGVWQEIFPVHGQCPARKAIQYAEIAGTETVVQFQMVANLADGERIDYDLGDGPGHDTGTMGASIGSLLYSAGVSSDPPGQRGMLGDIEQQGMWGFRHLRSVMDLAGGTVDNVARIMIMIRHPEDESAVMEYFREVFPDPDDAPAHYFAYFELNSQRSELVQLHVTGIL